MNKTLNRYLYVIYQLQERYCCVRSVDVAHYLGCSKASVSLSIRQLKDQGLIETEEDGHLRFTGQGRKHIDLLNERVCFFSKLLMDAGVDPDLARQDAINFSWEMSEASFEAFKKLA